MARTSVREMTDGSPMKLVLGFAAPLLFGFLFQQLYAIVDTAIVGRYLGADMLAAVGGTGSVNFLINGFTMGCCSGFAIPIAQTFGARDHTSMRRYVANAVYVCAVISILMSVSTALLCTDILRLMNTPEEILYNSAAYIRIIFAGIPATMLYNMAAGVLRSLGDSKTPVMFLILASLVNIALDLLFIIVFQMGVAGAAIATIISQLISGAGCVAVMVRSFAILRMNAEDRQFRAEYGKKLLLVGAPMGLQYSITAIGSVAIQWAVNGIGVTAVAAVAAAGKLTNFFACVFDALATTMATFAGQNVGARKLDRVGKGLWAASIIGVVYCLLALLVVLFFGPALIGLFVDGAENAEVVRLAQQFLTWNASAFVLLLFVNIVRLTVQGMGFTQAAMIAGVFEMFARLAVAMLLVPALGFNGACMANVAAWVAADAFLFPCYFRVLKKLKLRQAAAL